MLQNVLWVLHFVILYPCAVDILNNLHKEFGKTVRTFHTTIKTKTATFVVYHASIGAAGCRREGERKGLWQAEGVCGRPGIFCAYNT